LLTGCGGGDDADRARQQAAYDKLSRTNQPGTLSAPAMDSLRAMKARFNITRDDYWENKGGVLANDFFELWYPPGGVTVTHGMYAFGELFNTKKRFNRVFGGDPGDHLKVICAATMPSFKEATGLEWWVYSKIDGDEIHIQPVDVLYQRHLGNIAIPRGYYEWGIIKLSAGRAPQWLTQGFASLLADEEWFLENQLVEYPGEEVKMAPKDVDAGLGKTDDRKVYRIALYNAFRMVRRLNAEFGQDKMIEAIRLMGEGDNAGKAFEKTFGRSYGEVLEYAGAFQVNR
jgi:hypothetical protein